MSSAFLCWGWHCRSVSTVSGGIDVVTSFGTLARREGVIRAVSRKVSSLYTVYIKVGLRTLNCLLTFWHFRIQSQWRDSLTELNPTLHLAGICHNTQELPFGREHSETDATNNGNNSSRPETLYWLILSGTLHPSQLVERRKKQKHSTIKQLLPWVMLFCVLLFV